LDASGRVPAANMPEFADGEDGNSVLSGQGAPDPTVGRDGDFYIDTTTWEIYGPKQTTWGSGTSLVGPQGEQGPPGEAGADGQDGTDRSEEHTSELQSRENLVCRLLLE